MNCIIYTEALDRLSRGQWQIAEIYEKLSQLNIKIITLAEQEVNELHIGLKGTMNALFLKDLGKKSKRGQTASLENGVIPLAPVIGYKKNPDTRFWGKEPSQVEIIKHIFKLAEQGKPRTEIARIMEQADVPTIGFKKWNAEPVIYT